MKGIQRCRRLRLACSPWLLWRSRLCVCSGCCRRKFRPGRLPPPPPSFPPFPLSPIHPAHSVHPHQTHKRGSVPDSYRLKAKHRSRQFLFTYLPPAKPWQSNLNHFSCAWICFQCLVYNPSSASNQMRFALLGGCSSLGFGQRGMKMQVE